MNKLFIGAMSCLIIPIAAIILLVIRSCTIEKDIQRQTAAPKELLYNIKSPINSQKWIGTKINMEGIYGGNCLSFIDIETSRKITISQPYMVEEIEQ